MGVEGEEFGAGAEWGADGGVGFAAIGEDGGEVGEGFDVIDDGGFAEEPLDGGEGRADADLGALAFDGGEEGGFFAADVSACAFDGFEGEREAGVGDVGAEEPGVLEVGDGGVDGADGVRVFSADVEDACGSACEPTCGDHADEDAVGALFHEVHVDVGTGVAFVGVADDVFFRALGFAAGLPFEVDWEARAAAAAEPGGFEFGEEGVAIRGEEGAERGVCGFEVLEGSGEDGFREKRGDGVGEGGVVRGVAGDGVG